MRKARKRERRAGFSFLCLIDLTVELRLSRAPGKGRH